MSNKIPAPDKSRRRGEIDLLAVGELLADLISQKETRDLSSANNFFRYQGGSPANLAANMARAGNRTALIACLGKDNLGKYLIEETAKTGVITDYIVADPLSPTSLVIISKTPDTPDFIAYRTADRMIKPEHIGDELIRRSSIYHTTCFALSQEPAQSSILDGARRAAKAGCRLSIDANYAPSIWPNRREAQKVTAKYCRNNALVKISRDDVARLFDDNSSTPEKAIRQFHRWGAELVCLTQGRKGSMVSWKHGKLQQQRPAPKVKVVDATGAGDAFWAGFLTGWLDGQPPPQCLELGNNLAAMKLAIDGPLPAKVDRDKLYNLVTSPEI